MDWLNLHIPSALRSPEFVGSSPAERGAWLCVHAYAATIECGGRIIGAALWKDRQWQQACGVTLREVRAASKLIHFDGDDVVVEFYSQAREKQVQEGRAHALAGARARWGKDTQGHAQADAQGHRKRMPKPNAEGEGEGERKENTTPHSPPVGGQAAPAAEVAPVAPASTEPDPASKPAPKVRPRNPHYDALAAATDGPADKLTAATARAVGVALAEIRKVHPDLTPDEITRRAANYRAHFRDASLTATALAKHWARCDAAPRPTSALSTDMGIEELKRRHGGTF